jgi:uroporphyrinogen decarboxylase
MKPLLIKHLSHEPIGRLPVWLMRQAGRYLPSYRAIREKHSFWEMVTQPKIAAQVSLLPIDEIGVDAVIFFSDILSLPYGLGVDIQMKESIGPVVTRPFRDRGAFDIFNWFEPSHHTDFVGATLNQIASELSEEKALIGFAGAPWTVGCYLVEGQGKQAFVTTRHWAERDPGEFASALRSLSKATASYLKYQVDSGAHMVQIFDTWLGEMSLSFFTEHYLPILNELIESVQTKRVPVVYFAKNSGNFLKFFKELKADVVSVDHQMDLAIVDEVLEGKFSLQGNLDPTWLLRTESDVRRETRLLVEKARVLKQPAILNLGHGVLPPTPVANVRAFVEEAKTLWL